VERLLYIYMCMKTKRTIPIGVAILGVVAASVALAAVDGFLIEVGAVVGGSVLFGTGYVWYRRQWDQADEVRMDERVEWVAHRSGELAFRVSLALAMVLFAATEAGSIPITAKEGLVLLILGMVAARFGLYGWYNQQSV
jgi:drug/metabolite transporter (DMT)-like permease